MGLRIHNSAYMFQLQIGARSELGHNNMAGRAGLNVQRRGWSFGLPGSDKHQLWADNDQRGADKMSTPALSKGQRGADKKVSTNADKWSVPRW